MLSQPSVIARLMGMEPQPPTTTTKTTMITIDCSEEEETMDLLSMSRSVRATPFSSSSGEASSSAKAKLAAAAVAESKQSKCNPLLLSSSHSSSRRRAGEDYYRRCLEKMKRPLRRNGGRRWSSSSSGRKSYDGRRYPHPQEELLGRIREDFQAWLHASSSSSSQAPAAAVVVGKAPAECMDGRYVQMIAQANLRREKVLARCAGGHGGMSGCKVQEETRMNAAESEELSASGAAVDGETEKQRGAPTRIAILRPATGGGGPAVGTPATWKTDLGGGGMEEFLREVRERLRSEMAARSAPLPMARDTASSMAARSAPQSMAPYTASSMADGGKLLGGRRKKTTLSRSESFRVFRGDRKRAAAAAASPERWKMTSASPQPPPLTKAKSRGGRRGSSLQADALPEAAIDVAAESPRALLLRSFSAPATGFALLPRMIGAPDTGAELTSSSSRRSRSFSLVRGTAPASGLRQSFGIGGKLKQLLLMMHLSKKKKPPPPPSPCPLIPQVVDLAGTAPRSPVSPLEVEGHSRRRHFSLSDDFNNCSSFPELSPKCSSEFDAGGSPLEWKTSAAAPSTEEEEDGDPDKAYVREVLVAAGLWHDGGGGGGSEEGKTTSSSDVVKASMAAPIGEDVFDEIEDAYYFRRCRQREEECAVADAVDEEEERGRRYRRLLFDLANEALTQHQQCGGGNGARPSPPALRGEELEEEVWRRATAEEDTGDDPAAAAAEREVVGRRSAWLETPAAWEEEARGVGSKVERAILDDLVGQVVRHLLLSFLSQVNSTRSNLASYVADEIL